MKNLNPQQGPSAEIIRNSPVFKCDCGSVVFTEKLTFRKISAIISPTGKEEMAPIPMVICDKCGKVPSVFDPHNLAPKEIASLIPVSTATIEPVKTDLKIVR